MSKKKSRHMRVVKSESGMVFIANLDTKKMHLRCLLSIGKDEYGPNTVEEFNTDIRGLANSLQYGVEGICGPKEVGIPLTQYDLKEIATGKNYLLVMG